MSEPRVEEVGVRRHTYLFFEFGDDLAGVIVLGVVVWVIVVLLFVEAEGEWIGGFVVGVESVDEVLAPDSVIFSVIVEVADAGDFVPGFLGDRVVEDDVAVLRPARFTVFLEFFETFVVELLHGMSGCPGERHPSGRLQEGVNLASGGRHRRRRLLERSNPQGDTVGERVIAWWSGAARTGSSVPRSS
jgi:hypothetical protein